MQKQLGRYQLREFPSNIQVIIRDGEDRIYDEIYCDGDTPKFGFTNARSLFHHLSTPQQVGKLLANN